MNSKFDSESRIWNGVQVPWPFSHDLHISEIIYNALEKNPEHLVQINADDGTQMTSEGLRIKVVRIAQHLSQAGIKCQEVVSIVCSNSMNLMAFTNGIIQLGAIINPMSVDHSIEDLVHMFAQTKPKLVICDSHVYDKVWEALKKLESSATIYTTWNRVEGAKFADDLMEPTGKEEEYQTQKFEDPDHMVLSILTSSGTSGLAKGVCMSQTWFLKFASFSAPGTRSLSFSSIIWGSGFSSLITSTLGCETRIVTTKEFSPKVFFDIATEFKVTHWLMNPPKLTLLLQSPLIEKVDMSHVQLVMALGGMVAKPLRDRFKEVFPARVHFLIFYGLTEVSVAMTFPGYPIDDLTVGFIAPNHEAKVVDENGNALLPEETGEFYVKHSICRFLGYYNKPEGTQEALDQDGFIKTGDVGYINDQGFVYVIDRKKDIFKYKGYHINPSEIEDVINEIPAIEFVAVVGIPNPETYNLIAAVIKKKESFVLTEQEVIDFVARKLPEYKQISGGVYFVEEFPNTATGKILKRVTREIATKMFKERATR